MIPHSPFFGQIVGGKNAGRIASDCCLSVARRFGQPASSAEIVWEVTWLSYAPAKAISSQNQG
jgi:hypothetical protein